MELETLNKLYLELSQVTTARNERELVAAKVQAEVTTQLLIMRDMLSRIAYPRRDRDQDATLIGYAHEIRQTFSREELGID